MTSLDKTKKNLLWELGIATVLLLIIVRGLFVCKGNATIGPYVSTAVAVLFMYVPMAILWKMRRPMDFLDWSVNSYWRSVITFLIASVAIFPLFFFIAHWWQAFVWGQWGFVIAGIPDAVKVVLFQFLIVALPEEFYFRGYFQSTIGRVFEKPWRVLGANLGWAWIITALVFAFAHSAITFKWWHFSIFFPALVMGYLRERTGSITAPVLFHAAANVLMDWFSRSSM